MKETTIKEMLKVGYCDYCGDIKGSECVGYVRSSDTVVCEDCFEDHHG